MKPPEAPRIEAKQTYPPKLWRINPALEGPAIGPYEMFTPPVEAQRRSRHRGPVGSDYGTGVECFFLFHRGVAHLTGVVRLPTDN